MPAVAPSCHSHAAQKNRGRGGLCAPLLLSCASAIPRTISPSRARSPVVSFASSCHRTAPPAPIMNAPATLPRRPYGLSTMPLSHPQDLPPCTGSPARVRNQYSKSLVPNCERYRTLAANARPKMEPTASRTPVTGTSSRYGTAGATAVRLGASARKYTPALLREPRGASSTARRSLAEDSVHVPSAPRSSATNEMATHAGLPRQASLQLVLRRCARATTANVALATALPGCSLAKPGMPAGRVAARTAPPPPPPPPPVPSVPCPAGPAADPATRTAHNAPAVQPHSASAAATPWRGRRRRGRNRAMVGGGGVRNFLNVSDKTGPWWGGWLLQVKVCQSQ